MQIYDFDNQAERKGTDSLKWDWFGTKDVIPLWVADMDFRSPEPVIRALHERIDHGIFGYTLPPRALSETLVKNLETQYGWSVDPSWIVYIPGVVTGLNISCRVAGNPGDSVLVPSPVYPPFLEAPDLSGRHLIRIDMVEEKGRLTFDWNALEKAMASKPCLFLFCNPHNPGGTVFRNDELRRIADMAKSCGVMVCSDEIHCGLILDGIHRPIAAACPDIESRTITLMAPSKTYNIPGLGCSFAIIPDTDIRNAFYQTKKGVVPEVNALGYTAALAACKDGGNWLSQVLSYLRKNRDLVDRRIKGMPGLEAVYPESTYLTWIDARRTGIEHPARFFEDAGVGLSDGRYFGAPGFLRLNFGCSRPLLERALDRMEKALSGKGVISGSTAG